MKLSKKMKSLIVSSTFLLGINALAETATSVLADTNSDENSTTSTYVIQKNVTSNKSYNFLGESKVALPYVTNPDWGAPMGNSEMWDKFYDPGYKPGGGSPKRHKSSTKQTKKTKHH